MTERSSAAPCRVFISYAHESAEHAEVVRHLWLFLREHGVDAVLDLVATQERVDWALWMGDRVREADRVLVIASAAYRERAEGRLGSGEGRGVQWEARLIRDALYRDQQGGLHRFVPVVLPGQSRDGVPDFLAPATTTVYTVSEFTLAGAKSLLRLLLGQPEEIEPPLGPTPVFGHRDHASPSPSTRATQHDTHELPRRYVLPLYLAIDVSRSMEGPAIDAANNMLPAILDMLARNPRVADTVRFSVLSYSDDTRVHLAMRDPVCPLITLPRLVCRGGLQLAPLFEKVRDRISVDISQLHAEGMETCQPALVILISDNPIDPPETWQSALSRLTHYDKASRQGFPWRPKVFVHGVGRVQQNFINSLTKSECSYYAPGDSGMRRFNAGLLANCMAMILDEDIYEDTSCSGGLILPTGPVHDVM